ncbi:MAG TPA: hypothetical protein EYN54_14335 [Methylococcaceae bacterium]|nr:hypothetical protein [Methylococcaceae bacterium]
MDIKKSLESDIKQFGKNHINSKISELLNLGSDLFEAKDVKDKYQVVDFINDRVAIYKEILRERYS